VIPVNLPSTFIPSRYQRDFFAALLCTRDNLQLVACAGSGKTRSIEEALRQLPASMWKWTLVTAFNTHIKKELQERQQAGRIPAGVRISTIHGLGYSALRDRFGVADTRSWVRSDKYRTILKAAWRDFEPGGETRLSTVEVGDLEDAREAATDLLRLALVTMTDTDDPEALRLLARRHEIQLPAIWEDATLAVIARAARWGREGTPEGHLHPSQAIGYEDMIALPIALNVEFRWRYDLVFVDEAQDLSRAQLEIVRRVVRPGGRIVLVGDPKQAIYSFAGADADAFDLSQRLTGARRLPLSICYRCGREIVRLAQRYNPGIEPAEGAIDGAVVTVDEEALLGLAQTHARNERDTFLILARLNAPLVSAAMSLLRRGVAARILGRDIGTSLIRSLDEAVKLAESDAPLVAAVRAWGARKMSALPIDDEAGRMALTDRVDALVAILEAQPGQDVGGVRARILDLFSDESRGVTLSTIHKAKGLEARRVGILKPEMMPLPYARSGWQYAQELNLCYVAVTRAREELYLAGALGGAKGAEAPR
jgi:superfamily I DNA/RNA helicase